MVRSVALIERDQLLNKIWFSNLLKIHMIAEKMKVGLLFSHFGG